MSTLVVYYSLEGNTKFIAEQIAEAIHADLLSLHTRKPYPNQGFKKFFFGSKGVLLKEEPALTNGTIDWEKYDTIIIGTPVWVSTYAPPLRTFFRQNPIMNKRVALFACHGGGTAEKCFDTLKQVLRNNELIGEIDFTNAKEAAEVSSAEAKKWALNLKL